MIWTEADETRNLCSVSPPAARFKNKKPVNAFCQIVLAFFLCGLAIARVRFNQRINYRKSFVSFFVIYIYIFFLRSPQPEGDICSFCFLSAAKWKGELKVEAVEVRVTKKTKT